MQEILATFEDVASRPLTYAKAWKERTGGRVIGIFPMHFPGELAHAAGALPVILQEDQEPITVGLSSVFNFYCGYNRSIVDQAIRGAYEDLDAIMFGDHCVQLLGSADVIRNHLPDMPILFNQLIGTIDADWAMEETRGTFLQLRCDLEKLLTHPVTDGALRSSIALSNRNRQLIRQLYDMRRSGQASLTGRQMQLIVKSSMIMDRAVHTDLLEKLVMQIDPNSGRNDQVRVYLSGHLCQAPKPEILDLIEQCGGLVVDDDLYHGYRYVSMDMDEKADPIESITRWYIERNHKVPCPTRAAKGRDWESFLLDQVSTACAKGLIVLMAKFCEPHMYFYPEIKEAFEARAIPHLLIETEHEHMPLEALKTRVESFLEIVRRRAAA